MEKTFTEYVTEKRMEKARKLLRDTTVATAEIAATVGYKDSDYFSFVFKNVRSQPERLPEWKEELKVIQKVVRCTSFWNQSPWDF